MKVKKGFNLKNICGSNILVAEGLENIDFSSIISMNETAAYLWHKVENGVEFTNEDLASLLLDEYDVDKDTALNDCKDITAKWLEAGIIME